MFADVGVGVTPGVIVGFTTGVVEGVGVLDGRPGVAVGIGNVGVGVIVVVGFGIVFKADCSDRNAFILPYFQKLPVP